MYISLVSLFLPLFVYGQEKIPDFPIDTIPKILTDTIPELSPTDTIPQFSQTDSISDNPNTARRQNLPSLEVPVSAIDTTQRVNYWNITPLTGEIIPVVPDTFLTDYFNRTNVEGAGVSVAYLGSLGLPMESRVFFERADRSEFMFFDHFWAYNKAPEKFQFLNTKIPYSNLSYQSAGSRENKEERFQALLTTNFGKKLNAGIEIDYLYARGFYKSQSAKHTDWVFFGNYLSDRHQVHLFVNPSRYTNAENGGLMDSRWISQPEEMDNRNTSTQNIPTAFSNTWNRIKGNRYFLNYRFNLGFERDSTFIPVSSIIYTFDFNQKKHSFLSNDSANVNTFYNNADFLNPLRKDKTPNDSTSYHSIRNTLGLSLREGFSEWAKSDLTAFITNDIRQFTLMDSTRNVIIDNTVIPEDTSITFNSRKETVSSTYIGGELAKRTGKILRYNAQGSFGLLGYNIGDMHLSGDIETRIPFLNDTASITASGYFKNQEPTYLEKHYISRYFRWDNDFSKIQKYYIGGKLRIPHTKTELGVGVENITNYIYFGNDGYPQQYSGNVQVLAATLQQNFKFGALNWDNQFVFQTSTNDTIIPLPVWCAYSSVYFQFNITALTIQMGANVHIWARYASPTYEPATQQFRLQGTEKTGEYPLVCGFLNCHLKQTRFFIEYYNLGPMLLGSNPNYFSMPRYPVNSPGIRLGLSVDFHN